jgi:DNA-binding SARP family transcriptional activator/predicted ATPase
MLRLYTFGGLRIERDNQPLQLPTQRARDLLAYLVVFRDRPHPRAVLSGILWPDLPEGKARRRLSDTLWRVRRALGDCLAADDETIWFNTELPCWLDVRAFESGVQDDHVDASCLQLYRGPFLDGFFHDWVLLERERLHSLYLEAQQRLLEEHKQAGDYVAALEVARRLVTTEPLHEAAHRELMRLYHLLGRDAEAVAQYHRCCETLQEELGVSPAKETTALYHTLSGNVPATDMPSPHLPIQARHFALDFDELGLVGRDAERAALLRHLEAALSGQGGFVLLDGEPGIGKTRLARELVAGARWRNVATTTACAGDLAISSSYAWLLAALKPLLTPLRIRQLGHVVDAEHLWAVAPLLLSLAQVLPDTPSPSDLPPAQARGRIQQALIALVLGLGCIAPHLWVLEDLQWADAETLALLPLLLPRLTKSRTLFLLTGRSAELRANSAVWDMLQVLDRAGPFPRYTLGRLDADTIGSLVRGLLGENVPDLASHLLRESEGVPLFVVETLKMWRDDGYLLFDELDGWRLRGDVPQTFPHHLGDAVISHRLSYLSQPAETTLSVAAVIGPEVDFDLLAYVCTHQLPASTNTSDVDYIAISDELLRLGFLVETDDDYRFSHEQVCRIVYHRLAQTQRARLHRRIALALETLSPDRFELLAHHYAAAGDRQPAIHYLTRAAEQACGLFAHQAAAACYDRLLDLLIHPEDRLARYEVLHDRAKVLGWLGDREAQGRDLEEALELARALAGGASLVDAHVAATLQLRSEWYRLQGRYEPADEDALVALDMYRQMGDERSQATLLCQLGWNVVFTADSPRAFDYLNESLAIYRSLEDLQGQLDCLNGLTGAAELAGEYCGALSYVQESNRLAELVGDPHLISRTYLNLGAIRCALGDLEAAMADLQQALEISETASDRPIQASAHCYLGIVDTERDRFASAQAHLELALETFREVQDLSWEGDALAALGRLALLRGDLAAAIEYLQAAHQRNQESNELGYATTDLSYLARAELALGDEDVAWRNSLEAVQTLEAGLQGVEHPQRIYYNHFLVAQATRHWAVARTALERAADSVEKHASRIDDPALRKSYLIGLRVNRAIAEAAAELPPPGCLRVRLPRADAPPHRRPAPDETVGLVWTLDTGEQDAAPVRQEGKVAARRRCILRLCAEAEASGASPRADDLAGALQVTPRTIRTDLAALHRQGHAVCVCGRID